MEKKKNWTRRASPEIVKMNLLCRSTIRTYTSSVALLLSHLLCRTFYTHQTMREDSLFSSPTKSTIYLLCLLSSQILGYSFPAPPPPQSGNQCSTSCLAFTHSLQQRFPGLVDGINRGGCWQHSRL